MLPLVLDQCQYLKRNIFVFSDSWTSKSLVLNAGLFQMKNLVESHPSSKTPGTLEQHQDSFLPQLSWSSGSQSGEEGARKGEDGEFCKFFK